MTRVVFGCERCIFAVGVLRFGNFSRERILFAGSRSRRGKVRRWLAEALAAQACKEARQPVIIFLAPALVGMMVTAGALQADAEKYLRRIRRDLMQLIVSHLPIPVDRRSVLPFARCRDHPANEFVIRTIPRD